MRKALVAGAIFALLGAVAGAQESPQPAPGGPVKLIKLPNGDYTVPMSALQGSGTTGDVTLHPVGLRTLVTVRVYGSPNHRHKFNLHEGSDCTRLGPPHNIALAPARTGLPSQTLVSLPIDSLTSKDYIVAAQDATNRKQFEEACARL